MEVQTYVGALRDEGSAMADCARDHLGLPIPCCPGWDMAELVEHVGEMHHAICELILSRAMDPDQIEDPVPPTTGLVDWFEAGVEDLARVLLEADPAQPVWTWSEQNTVSFWQRRMAIETAVHRWDAESAVGNPGPVEASLAADGIDEFFTLHMLRDGADLRGDGELLHFHSSDSPGDWTLRLGAGARELITDHRSNATSVRATASDLLLLLWRRLPAAAVDVSGDDRLLRRFLERMDLT
ncbi:MAG: maleylpyruvate isomerase family mycothiol-dependent enzyme [Actinomycetota bacterium]